MASTAHNRGTDGSRPLCRKPVRRRPFRGRCPSSDTSFRLSCLSPFGERTLYQNGLFVEKKKSGFSLLHYFGYLFLPYPLSDERLSPYFVDLRGIFSPSFSL